MNEKAQKKEPQKLTEAELRYWAGYGLLRNVEESGKYERGDLGSALILQAAEMGCSIAKVEAGQQYVTSNPKGTAEHEKGLALLREAVADGCEEGEMALAMALYSPHHPVHLETLWGAAHVLWHERNDLAAANRLMGRAAYFSYVPAMKDYAKMLREGIGGERDLCLANQLEARAAEVEKGR